MDLLKQSSSTRENLGLLAVMDAIHQQDRITQRELAHKTGLNLKKVNFCLNKLLEKGYVKFQRVRQNPDKRGYLYVITPAGLKAKSQLTYRFLKFTIDFYNRMEEKLQNCLHDMRLDGVTRIVLYGVSDAAKIVIGMAGGLGIEVIGVIDEEFQGQVFHGVNVSKGLDIKALVWDRVLITSLDEVDVAEARLVALGVPSDLIWKLV